MKVAADANVLLSALIGGQAKRVLYHPEIEEVLTTEFTLAEVQEYAGVLARKRRLAVDLVLLAAAALPVTTVPRALYRSSVAEARKRIGRRDPDDVELLALAMQLNLAVWSNDNDFENTGVAWLGTRRLRCLPRWKQNKRNPKRLFNAPLRALDRAMLIAPGSFQAAKSPHAGHLPK